MPDIQDDIEPFAALRPPAVEALARILFFKRATTTTKTLAACDLWLTIQKRHVAHLRAAAAQSAAICRPGTLSLLADVFFRGELAKPQELLQAHEAAALCDAHRDLNPRVLMALMTLVTRESTFYGAGAEEEEEEGETREEERRESRGRVLAGEHGAHLGALDGPDALGGRDAAATPHPRADAGAAPMLPGVQAGRRGRLGAVSHGPPDEPAGAARARAGRDVHAARVRPAAAAHGGRLDRRVLRRGQEAPHPRESDLLVPAVLALRADMTGAGAGGAGGGREKAAAALRRSLEECEEERKYTRRGWPMPLLPPMREVDVDKYVGVMSDEDEEEEEDDGYVDEDGYVAGRWQRRRRTTRREGYSQYLPVSVAPASAEMHGKRDELLGWQRRTRAVSVSSIDTTTATINLPDELDQERQRRGSIVEQPWTINDHDPPTAMTPSTSIPPAQHHWPPPLRCVNGYSPVSTPATDMSAFPVLDNNCDNIQGRRGLESTAASRAAAAAAAAAASSQLRFHGGNDAAAAATRNNTDDDDDDDDDDAGGEHASTAADACARGARKALEQRDSGAEAQRGTATASAGWVRCGKMVMRMW
ncbi:hypothetical protein PWT90_04016 [Aphanocladium album]|nr:hypothetical protein PWT90_04016 [Aphanocladium album]